MGAGTQRNELEHLFCLLANDVFSWLRLQQYASEPDLPGYRRLLALETDRQEIPIPLLVNRDGTPGN